MLSVILVFNSLECTSGVEFDRVWTRALTAGRVAPTDNAGLLGQAQSVGSDLQAESALPVFDQALAGKDHASIGTGGFSTLVPKGTM